MKYNMKMYFVFFVLFFQVIAYGANDSSAPSIKVTGVYSNMEINKNSGDILGIEIIVSEVGDKYYLTFQSGEGEARKPLILEAMISGSELSFVTNELHGYQGLFKGEITEKGILGGFVNGQLSHRGEKVFLLKRKGSFWNEYSY